MTALPRRSRRLGLVPLAALLLTAPTAMAQVAWPPPCNNVTKIEFMAPMPTEEVPVIHGPMPQAWHVILEAAMDQVPGSIKPIYEGHFLPSPGLGAPIPTDLNGDAVLGDRHPAAPGLVLKMDDDLMVNGIVLPAGTNLASLIEMIGTEKEHGRKQSTTFTWIIDAQYLVIDLNGDLATNMTVRFHGARDKVKFRHGHDPVYKPCSLPSTPTVSIFGPDWISKVDSDVSDMHTPFVVGVECRIPCYWDPSTNPPTPLPLDPVPGPGGMVATGNFPLIPGPGAHPSYNSLYVTFSDDYMDIMTGSGVGGGVVAGGTCATIYGVTGQNLAFAFEQASVAAWYGVDGVPTFTPTLSDDQLIYRFTMMADGMIMDSDVLQKEMMITASVETECNLFSITNVRVKHRPGIKTPDPNP